MFILTKCAVLFLSPDGAERFRAPNGYMGDVPGWVTRTRQFDRMVQCGLIVATATAKDKELQAAMEKNPKPEPEEQTEAEPAAEPEKGNKKTGKK